MRLSAGSKLGPYEILSPLGAGGMGEVYRARDTRLGREVAIKVLPADRLADETRRRRFVHEARAASALNHPNIVTIHEIETADGIDFIVMEYVRGKTLGDLIRPGLALREALRIAISVADALVKAHAAGIVHRDLKPANVMVSDEGTVKVVDFGLAKLIETAPPSEAAETQSARPSLSHAGTVLGTPGYMSPEQAIGGEVDSRSDVFSFGALLYEMVTGRRAFAADSAVETLAKVVSADPTPASQLSAGIPRELDQLIQRCLRKQADRRFQSMADVKVTLEDLYQETAPAPAAASITPPSRARWMAAGAVGLLLTFVGTAVLWPRRGSIPTEASRPLTRLTWDSGLTTDAAPSPAGNLIAYATDRSGDGNLDIWIQPLPSGEAIRLTRNAADDYEPAFSPDGSQIAFRSDRDGGGVYVVSALGGQETRIADKGRRPRYSPDGRSIVYWVGDITWVSSEVYVIPATGGSPRQLGESRLSLRYPIWSPDGSHVLCMGYPTAMRKSDWLAFPVAGGATSPTGIADALARPAVLSRPEAWTADREHVLFSASAGDSTDIWRIGLSPRTWKVTSAPERITFGAAVAEKPAVLGRGVFFTSVTTDVNLWSLSLDATAGATREPMLEISKSLGRDDWPSLSADGSKLAFLSERSGTRQVWWRDLESGREVAVTRSPSTAAYPRISADGSSVGYLQPEPQKNSPASSATEDTSLPPGQSGRLFVVSVARDGVVGIPRELCRDCGRLWDWSRNGKYVLSRGPGALMLHDAETGARTEIMKHPGQFFMDSRFSPDDKWIAFTSSTGTFTRQTFISPFRGPAAIPESSWTLVIDGKTLDRQVAWAPDGNMLYYQSERDGYRCLWAQRLDPTTKHAAGEPFPIQHFHGVQRSMTTAIGDPGSISISAGRKRLVFSLGEMSGNIWTTTY